MEFRAGRPLVLPEPPQSIPAHPIVVQCPRAPIVSVGQPVDQGHLLVEPDEADGCACLSPIAGVVGRITPVEACRATGRGAANSGSRNGASHLVTIDPGTDEVPAQMTFAPPRGRTLDDWVDVMRTMPPWAVDDGYVGLTAQVGAAKQRKPDRLICVGFDPYPPYPVHSSLLMSFSDDIVLGTLILADVFSLKEVVLLASKSQRVLSKVRPSCRNFQLQLTTVDNTYPCADPTLVVWAHTPEHRRLAVGLNPVREAGVVLVNPWTAIQTARWYTRGAFDLVRPMMIGWPRRGADMTACYAFAGQPISSLNPRLANSLAGRDTVILGNPMADDPVCSSEAGGAGQQGAGPWVPQDELLITVLEALRQPESAPCVSCGWCVDICPTGLRPDSLFELCRTGRDNPQRDEQLRWCIHCGLCSHVCPSALPLSLTFRETGVSV